jgi:tetratricopeptide (TPR) repeat protein
MKIFSILIFLFFVVLSVPDLSSASVIALKSGKKIDAEIIESTEEYIKIIFNGTPLFYTWEYIASIDGKPVPKAGKRRTGVKVRAAAETAPAPAPAETVREAAPSAQSDLVAENLRLREELVVIKSALRDIQAKYFNNLGGTFLYEKMFDRAMDAFVTSIEINPWNPEACFNLGLLYEKYKKNPRRAVEYYQQYLELFPEAPDRVQVIEHIKSLQKQDSE